MLKRYSLFCLPLVASLTIASYYYTMAKSSTTPDLDAFICISSEDDIYNVKGGIGTYLAVLTKEIKRIYPHMEIHWITKSHNASDFSEIDAFGIHRHYLSDTNPYQDKPFCKHLELSDSAGKALLDQEVFLNKANAKLSEILATLKGKKVAIECGEWEGIAHQVFRVIDNKDILKVARIHTPLAVTMISNKLPVSTTNKLQLIHEYETLNNVDCVTSCTNYMKVLLVEHVLGDCQAADQIRVIPNPVDSKNYKPGTCSRSLSIDKVNALLGKKFLTQDTYNIYFIGSVETRKGAELAMAAVATIAAELPQARFCFFGHHGGNASKNLTANTKLAPEILYEKIPVQYRDQVAFSGYVDHAELPSIMESGDVFPIMYLGDNFPGAVAEISLMEKPILALSRGGVHEMLCDKNGELVAYDLGTSLKEAPAKLAQGVIELYHNPQQRLNIGRNLGALIRGKYEPEKITREIIEFYSDCLLKKN